MAKAFSVESVIMDTGILYALADRKDKWHSPSAKFVKQFRGKLIVPSTVIPEVCYLINTYLGRSAEQVFIRALADWEFAIEHFTHNDLVRCLDVLEVYVDANIGFVDASLVAISERLNIPRILTTDRRHFSMIRPNHCTGFELLP
ncbi:MAG: PIN domain-containing protein [Deltaproteobacteria bacterium]|nr:PIN domain-containing protein [Deltaproteobacteria bacterium]